MLQIKNVTKCFGEFKALDNLTMTVPKGTVYGLVGPNGAGKSTAIRLLTGVYTPDEGQLTMDGQPIYENTAAKARIGYIPDEIFYFPSATLEEMRSFYRGLYPKFDDALFMRSSICPPRVPSAASLRVCRSRRPSTWPFVAVRMC